jgi:hypothetical protein
MTDIINILIGMLFFVCIILIHEAGHYIIFRLHGFKAGLKFNMAGDLEIGRELHNKITVIQSIPISMGGVALGYAGLGLGNLIFDQTTMIMFFVVYSFLCFGDFQSIILCMYAKDKNLTLMQMNINLWKDYVQTMTKAGEKIDING